MKNSLLNIFLFSAALFAQGVFVSSYADTKECLTQPGVLPLPKNTLDTTVNTVSALTTTIKSHEPYDTFLDDTLASLEKMRGKNGLVVDKAQVIPATHSSFAKLNVLNSKTSPTNIALDLMIQSAMGKTETIDRVLTTLENPRFPRHKSGLFYSWYETDKIANSATLKDVSAIDNLHLALALWTVAQKQKGTPLGARAQALFSKMDFSEFYDPKNGLSGGNLHFTGKDAKGHDQWKLDAYQFSYLGAEARSLYSVGYALGVFKNQRKNKNFTTQAVKNGMAEFYKSKQGKILRTWDGGAFQLLLPEELVSESRYSPVLKASARNYGKFILAQGEEKELGFPDAHSASQYGIEGDTKQFTDVPPYVGPAGSVELVATTHQDVNDPQKRADWDRVYTPHAAMMAASVNPSLFAKVFEKEESYHSGRDSLYNVGIGWSDGVHVKGPDKGKVVPVVLSLDQSMIALSILKIQDPDGLGPSARALHDDPVTRARLQEFYRDFDQKASPDFKSK